MTLYTAIFLICLTPVNCDAYQLEGKGEHTNLEACKTALKAAQDEFMGSWAAAWIETTETAPPAFVAVGRWCREEAGV